jgi:two-component system alkaline phosphatase synthesis response regulator PhoP
MPAQPHILIVEDEQTLADTLALNLRIEKYEVTIVRTGREAQKVFSQINPGLSLVLLDVMLPDISGFDLCREFKSLNQEVPVIFLTSKNQPADKIGGLKLGADDYVTKPFDLEELLLRISNLLKRSRKENTPVFKFPGGEINYQTFEIVDCNGAKHTLSRREMGLLELLTGNVNKVISRDEIIDKLWDISENASSRTIDNYILNFRKYFEKNPKAPSHFHSIRGVGYKFSV